MNYLKEQELQTIDGGVIKLSAAGGIVLGAIATFIIGAVNGYLRPLACKSDK